MYVKVCVYTILNSGAKIETSTYRMYRDSVNSCMYNIWQCVCSRRYRYKCTRRPKQHVIHTIRPLHKQGVGV